MIKISEMIKSDRPRERLSTYGVENLSNDELLTIILSSGTKNISVKELSFNILKQVKDIKKLNNITLEELLKIKGIGVSKACTILACIELGKRINTNIDNLTSIKFTSPDIIYDYYKNKLKNKKQEYFYTIYLDSSKKIIKEKLLFIGTINMSIVTPREVFKEAYLCDATSIVCVHNHPSGNVLPSREDINLTRRLKEVGLTFGVNIIDHIIIGNKYYSFYENGDL